MEKHKSEYETKFCQDEKVSIKKGFYKGKQGVIKDVEHKENIYLYTIQVQDKKTKKDTEKIQVREELLSKRYF